MIGSRQILMNEMYAASSRSSRRSHSTHTGLPTSTSLIGCSHTGHSSGSSMPQTVRREEEDA